MLAVAAVAVGAAGVVLAAQDRGPQGEPDDAGGQGLASVVAVAVVAVLVAAPFAGPPSGADRPSGRCSHISWDRNNRASRSGRAGLAPGRARSRRRRTGRRSGWR